MTNKVTVLFNAYLKLSDAEKDEFKQQLRDYDGKGSFEKGQLNERFNEQTKRIMGPTSGFTCQLCGK